MKKLIIAGALAAAVTTVSMGSVSAGAPAVKGCFGASVSGNASAEGNYAQSYVLPYKSGGLAFEVQFVKAGSVPDSIYPNSCND